MEVYSALVVCFLVSYGIDWTDGDSTQYESLHLEVARFQEKILHETIEIQEWTSKLERLKESILGLKKEKEFIQAEGKLFSVTLSF